MYTGLKNREMKKSQMIILFIGVENHEDLLQLD